ncbi:signal recognition particle receptor subunit beta-like isoform X1 [Gossypium australe]|uniref:Signal recognition particle receptor subunit beta-like isoform X1 n=1 Tax=Gossypium australe TaxID=47621 RepID=A0A5B6UE78_9ROSI|nr:signal recognition particle receptor subunit beta-like isoform X1 [Gossypium australe]
MIHATGNAWCLESKTRRVHRGYCIQKTLSCKFQIRISCNEIMTAKTNHLLQLPFCLDPKNERIHLGSILIEEYRFLIAFNPHPNASFIISI